MRMRWTVVPVALLTVGLLLGTGCSDSATATKKEVCGNFLDDDGNGLIDCADPACAGQAGCNTPQPDNGVPNDNGVQPDQGVPINDNGIPTGDQSVKPPSPLAAVMDKLLMPTGGSQYARDMDGTGPKNQLGAIIGAIITLAPTANLQGSIDAQINSGSLILLFDLLAKSLTDDPAMVLAMGQGNDLDGNPADNFSGSEEFVMTSTGTNLVKVNGKIVGSKLTAEGDVAIAIPFGSTPTVITLKKGQVTADVSANGLTNGVVSGAIPQSEVTNSLIPAIAQLMNDPNIDPTIKGIFDSDKNGTITAAELQGNFLIGFLLAPDIDTDGDNKKDALSIGLGFTAMSCKIQPY